jgi:hypothetical protein
LTDILVAADNGVGFINNKKLNDAPVILLKDIAFSNAVGSEYTLSSDESNVLVHAVSTHGELFVARGVRHASTSGTVEFPLTAVPIPIRNDVRNISGKVNSVNKSFEIVYATKDDDGLRHLARDPETSLWKETELIAKAAKANNKVKTPAFLVTVALGNGRGAPVPAGYNVQLSSAPTLVYINDRSYNLSRRPQTIQTNSFGQLQIAVPSADSLGAEPISIKFMPDTNETQIYNIQPAQRILHNLGQLKTGEALKNAKTYDNRPLFSEAVKSKQRESFDQAAEVFSKLPDMIAATHSSKPMSGEGAHKEIAVAWQKDESGLSSSAPDWISGAMDATGEYLGDAIEFLKKTVKGVAKFALKIAGPAIRLILKIGAKVIRFVLDKVSSIASGLISFLEGAFDVNLSFIRDWFTFRYKKVEATQKVSTK